MGGTLIIEIYEYTENMSSAPEFAYIPCELKGKDETLKSIIERGFAGQPRNTQDTGMRLEVLQKLEEAGIGKIVVRSSNPGNGSDPFVELTNVVPDGLYNANAARRKQNNDYIILKGRYRLSAGNEVTELRDAQRLTLIYSSAPDGGDQGTADEDEIQREICLNITYLQE